MYYSESILFGSGGRSNYRIPSVVADRRGNVYAFCNDRRDTLIDHAEETDLVCRIKRPYFGWSKPMTLAHVPGWACVIGSALYDDISDTVFCSVYRNPVAKNEFGKYTEDDKKRMREEAERKAREAGVKSGSFLIYTDDGGESWKERPMDIAPAEFVNIDGDTVKIGGSCHGSAHGIRLRHGEHAGRLICPSRFAAGEYSDWEGLQRYSYNNAVFSDDRGLTWRASSPVQRGTGEGTLIENEDGSLTYNSRGCFHDQKRYLATSHNGGESWEDFRTDDHLIEEKNIGCNASFLHVERGDLADPSILPDSADSITLFANPRSETRTNMTVCVSFDSGKSWSHIKTVYEGACAYSSLDYNKAEGNFVLLYEKGESHPYEFGMSIAEFDPEWLLAK